MNATVDTSAAIKIARARLRAQDFRGALSALKPAIDIGTRTGEMMELVGVAQAMAGNPTASRRAFAEATTLDPGRATAHYNYAVVLSRDGELEMAAEEAGAAVLLDPGHSGAVQLREDLARQIRDRKHIGEETFQTVASSPDMNALRSSTLGQLTCGVCGKKNLFSARVCRHCGTFIKEMPDVVPVE